MAASSDGSAFRFVRVSCCSTALVVAAFVAPGCAAPPAEEQTGSNSDPLTELEFDTRLQNVRGKYASCLRSGDCVSPTADVDGAFATEDASATTGGLGTASLAPRGMSAASQSHLCDAVDSLAGLEHAYFFVGGSVDAGAGAQGTAGLDIVWDLYDRQAATFGYYGVGPTTTIGAGASAYMGYAFGEKSSVIDAWSGPFVTATGSASLPLIGASASRFKAPDGTIVGGAIGLNISISVPAPFGASLVAGQWTPWDVGTDALGSRSWFVSFDTRNAAYGRRSYHYLQFKSAEDIALSILEYVGFAGLAPATHALALGMLRERGATVTEACHAAKKAKKPT